MLLNNRPLLCIQLYLTSESPRSYPPISCYIYPLSMFTGNPLYFMGALSSLSRDIPVTFTFTITLIPIFTS